ncbi:phosphoserine aminotransferase [Crepidotus variabilis]|uniref:phosphoserine transaminase n=1 Tax=Crepidotus variabilis TaxID=179855 RepID=A0A9P6ERC5_9AGAR|nr:phosphoserine aminotransferase [Crepidotus variabilis]
MTEQGTSTTADAAANRVINFGAGPSALPLPVLQEASQAILNFQNTGIGIAEISHRSKEFTACIQDVEQQIRTQLQVPPTHEVLFLAGGGTAQFAGAVLNMLARSWLLNPEKQERTLDYVLTGSWSVAAKKEADRLVVGPSGTGVRVNVVVDGREGSVDGKSFESIPGREKWKFSEDSDLIYYCENETVSGTQFGFEDVPAVEGQEPVGEESALAKEKTTFPFELLPEGKLWPLVGDYSSSFMSRPIPRLADHAIIYAGVQKNLGPAGVTIVIVRHDCIVDVDAAAKLGAIPVPACLSYKAFKDGKNTPNTPSVFSIYVCGLVLKRNAELGGIGYYLELNRRKKEKVYKVVKEGEAKRVLRLKVKEASGSWMNVVFTVLGEGAEARFLEGADERGMKGLKGHRSVGGIRVSLYNAVTEEEVDKLVAYIREFIQEEQKGKPSLPSETVAV